MLMVGQPTINKSALESAAAHTDAAEQCVHPIPDKERRGHGGGTLRGAFSGSVRGLKWVPSKWRRRVPPTSTPKGHNAHRWAATA
jgi:hypothetical protein